MLLRSLLPHYFTADMGSLYKILFTEVAEMKSRCRNIAYWLFMTTSVALISGCSSGSEFTGVPQEGAMRSGAFPTFNNRPQAATDQFTSEEQKQLTSSLDRDRTQLKTVKGEAPVTNAELELLRKSVQEEKEAVLKAIETSGD